MISVQEVSGGVPCGDHPAGRIHPKHEHSCFRGADGNIRRLDDAGIALAADSATRCAKGACPAIEAVRYSQTSIGGVLVIVGLVLLFQCTRIAVHH